MSLSSMSLSADAEEAWSRVRSGGGDGAVAVVLVPDFGREEVGLGRVVRGELDAFLQEGIREVWGEAVGEGVESGGDGGGGGGGKGGKGGVGVGKGRFVLVRLGEASWGFVSLVPGSATVRERMFCSVSKEPLQQKLGKSFFSGSAGVTDESELAVVGEYLGIGGKGGKEAEAVVGKVLAGDGSGGHVVEGGGAGGGGVGGTLVSRMERALDAVDRAAALSASTGMSRPTHSVSGASVGFAVEEDALGALEGLKARGVGLVRLDLDVSRECFELGAVVEGVVGRVEGGEGESGLEEVLSHAKPTFFAIVGGIASIPAATAAPNPEAMPESVLLYYCPDDSPLRAKMMASSAKASLIAQCKARAGITFRKQIEAHDQDDLHSHFSGPAASPTSTDTPTTPVAPFQKPKRKGRGKRRVIEET